MRIFSSHALLVAIFLASLTSALGAEDPDRLPLSGLRASVTVIRDSDGVPHIYAQNDHDAFFAMGYLQAQDRLFQMDLYRHQASGTAAELLGEEWLEADINFRTLGVRRAAEESWEVLSPHLQSILEAYAQGVNAYLKTNSLPPQYSALELSSIEPWTALDSLTIAKGLSFQLSFDLDLDLTLALDAYQEQGDIHGFDGTVLFFEDLFRSQPFQGGVSTVPPASSAPSRVDDRPEFSERVGEMLQPETLELARNYLNKIRSLPGLDWMTLDSRIQKGSNWWVVSGDWTESGHPILANDPHLGLESPPIFHEIHISVSNDPEYGSMNVSGVSFAGTPAIAQGCNERICWGSTVNPMDVTDTFEEKVAVSLSPLAPTATFFEGKREPLVTIQQSFRYNATQSGTLDDLRTADVGPTEGGTTYLVPRRNMGPLIAVSGGLQGVTGLSVQYAGFRATRELECFARWMRAGNLREFKEGLQYFDLGNQNFAYADVEGNIAYFAGGEMPIREDLEEGSVDNRPPFLIRDGTHTYHHEWLPVQNPQPGQALGYEILSAEEMPHSENPAAGFLINANNDPVGTTFDNNPFNQFRDSGGIFYLNPGYVSLRAGRISELFEEHLSSGKLDSTAVMQMQADNQLLDAKVFTPHIFTAFENAGQPGAVAALADLAADPKVSEAVERLRDWDFTTPTGIQDGYDPGDDPEQLPVPTVDEVRKSVAATIYATWRARFIQEVVDKTLEKYGLGDFKPDSIRSLSAIRNLLDNFATRQGKGASGVQFFDEDLADSPSSARDLVILRSLRDALNLLAGEQFAGAYSLSTDQDDYRWGKLHRLTLEHPVGEAFSIPPGGGFQDLAVLLPGLARAGGLETVDAAGFSARAMDDGAFRFSSGPARRFVGELIPGAIAAHQIIPGGQSERPGDSRQASQLGRWLTNQYHPLLLERSQVEAAQAALQILDPTQSLLYFPFFEGNATEYTGFGVSNLTGSPATLRFSAWDRTGALLPFAKNPSEILLPADNQLAELGAGLFDIPGTTVQSGWVELQVQLNGDPPLQGPPVASFTQFGSFDLTRMDGGTAWTYPSKRLVFTRVFEGPESFRGQPATTRLALVNPGDTETGLRITLHYTSNTSVTDSQKVVQALPASRSTTLTVGPKAGVLSTLSELFEEQIFTSDGYLDAEVVDGGGICGFAAVRLTGTSTVMGLNAQPPSGFERLFSAQLASTPLIFTSIGIINTSDSERHLSLRAVASDGNPIFPPVEVTLGAGQWLQQDAAEWFAPSSASAGSAAPTETSFDGSLVVDADGAGIVGDVVFGDPKTGRFAAALPLQTQKIRRAVFSQVASTPDFFTGLAFYNPSTEASDIQVQVFSKEGELIGEAGRILQAGERISELIPAMVPGAGDISGGFIVVSSDQPLIAQLLFGTYRLSLMSAVPPTVVE